MRMLCKIVIATVIFYFPFTQPYRDEFDVRPRLGHAKFLMNKITPTANPQGGTHATSGRLRLNILSQDLSDTSVACFRSLSGVLGVRACFGGLKLF